jgi:hypothetical protein
MNDLQRGPTCLREIKGLAFPWRKVLQNPLWYVAVVTLLAGLTLYLRALGWLTGVVALVWGLWLVWQLFLQAEPELDRNRPLANYLEQVLTYQSNINQMLQATAGKRYYPQQQRLAARIDLWVEAVNALVEQISGLDHHFLLQQDLVAVPKAIKNLEKELASQAEPILRIQMEQTLSNRQKQLASLQQLQTTIKQVEIQLENTLALLGTICSHLLAAQSTNQVADYYRLLGDVDQAVNRLQDYLYALQEVRGVTEHNHLDAYEAHSCGDIYATQ